MNVPENYIELQVLTTSLKEQDMGLTGNTDLRIATIDLDTVFSFWDQGNNLTVLCDECGVSMFVASIGYKDFQKLFFDYRNKILTFDNKN